MILNHLYYIHLYIHYHVFCAHSFFLIIISYISTYDSDIIAHFLIPITIEDHVAHLDVY